MKAMKTFFHNLVFAGKLYCEETRGSDTKYTVV